MPGATAAQMRGCVARIALPRVLEEARRSVGVFNGRRAVHQPHATVFQVQYEAPCFSGRQIPQIDLTRLDGKLRRLPRIARKLRQELIQSAVPIGIALSPARRLPPGRGWAVAGSPGSGKRLSLALLCSSGWEA